MRRWLYTLVFGLFASAMAFTAQAQLVMPEPMGGGNASFEAFAGTWTGQQTRSNGEVRSITIEMQANGRYSWSSDGQLITNGRLSQNGDEIRYRNNAGSRGQVTGSGSRLVWRNTFTGNNYSVTVSR